MHYSCQVDCLSHPALHCDKTRGLHFKWANQFSPHNKGAAIRMYACIFSFHYGPNQTCLVNFAARKSGVVLNPIQHCVVVYCDICL